jgi:hypothetical protein
VRALFAAVRLGLDRSPELFGRLRLHFIGTSYSSNGSAPHDVLTLASEAGVAACVSQQAARVPYLDSLQVMLDSQGLFLVGSDEPHYTASKIFPYLLARRPLLAIFHEQSSVVSVLNETGAGQVVSFSEQSPVSGRPMEISQRLESMLGSTTAAAPANCDVTESYSTRHMTARLARVFDSVLAESGSTQGAAA